MLECFGSFWVILGQLRPYWSHSGPYWAITDQFGPIWAILGLGLAPWAPLAPKYDPIHIMGCTSFTILCLSTIGHHFNSLVLPFVQKVWTLEKKVKFAMLGGLQTGLSGPLKPPWGVNSPWRMFPYAHIMVSGSTDQNKKWKQLKQCIFWNNPFWGILGSKTGPPSTRNPPPWVQTSVGVDQLDHCCVFLPKGTLSILWCYHICTKCELWKRV
jgi:hypothetical protein